MAAPAYRSYRKRSAPRAEASRRDAGLRNAPPSGDLINAVIQYADLIKDMGGGRSALRLSERRRSDQVICEPLGREAPRLADITVIWNDEQDEIVRVLDAARGDATLSEADMQPFGLADVELTAEALAYLAASRGCVH